MGTIGSILVTVFLIVGLVIVFRRRRRAKFLKMITQNIGLVEARAGYEQSREIVILQMLDPMNSGYSKEQANDHLQRSEAFMDRIFELEGGTGGPEYRLQTHQRLLHGIEIETARRNRETVVSRDDEIQKNLGAIRPAPQ